MTRKLFLAAIAAGATVLITACGDDPVPTAPQPPSSSAPATLKVSAPTVVSPSGGGTLNTRTPTLVLRPSSGTYVTSPVSYEIQVLTTGGDVAYSRTISGGAASGQGTLSHNVETPLALRVSYRWRARAVSGTNAGPWSDASMSGPAMFVTQSLTPGASNDEFREYFFSVIAQRNLGLTATQQGIAAMEPDLVAVGIIIAKDSSGSIRGRIYLPTGGADKYARSVDVVTGFGTGQTWTWVVRGATKCEGICP